MNAPWLFAEAYKYRRLHECFSVSKFWSDYDVFYRQKVRRCHACLRSLTTAHRQCDTFSRSTDAVFELSMRFADPFKISDDLSAQEKLEAERLMFLELTQGLLIVLHILIPHGQVNQSASGETPPIFLS
jgi:damage-control phosphatase, subfamily III